MIFHLASIVSGEAEIDFDKGYRINLIGMLGLLEMIRRTGDGYHPKVVFTSSIAVFGAPFPHSIPDEFHLTPLTSYGTQKAIGELLLADYTRSGFLDGVGIRLPTICVRPGKPNKAASGFFSGIIREPLAGQEAVLPVNESVRHTHASPRSAVGFLIHAAGLTREQLGPRINLTMPGTSCTVGEQIDALRRDRRRHGRGAHPPRAGRAGHAHRRRLGAARSTRAARASSASRRRIPSTTSCARISTMSWAARSRREALLRVSRAQRRGAGQPAWQIPLTLVHGGAASSPLPVGERSDCACQRAIRVRGLSCYRLGRNPSPARASLRSARSTSPLGEVKVRHRIGEST